MRVIFSLAALFAVLAVSASHATAANVTFSGLTAAPVSTSGLFQIGKNFTLSVDYDEDAGASGNVTGSTLSVETNTGIKTFILGDGAGTLSLLAGDPTVLQISISYDNPNAAAGQPYGGTLLMNVTGASQIPRVLSAANVAQIVRGGNAYSGNLTSVSMNGSPAGLSRTGFSGTLAVPEPGSIGLLTGLGCVVGRRLWRRRQQKQTSAV
jgi:hypothetical protein